MRLCLFKQSFESPSRTLVVQSVTRSLCPRDKVRLLQAAGHALFGGLTAIGDGRDPYWKHAATKLTHWQGSLFPKMAALYRASTNCAESWGCPNRPTEPFGHERFSLFHPVVDCPPGMQLSRWGSEGDGGKWLCGVEKLKEKCVILSLGSNGQFDFEESMLQNTPCEVHTFDCTYDGNSLGPRHHYHKQCLGSAQKAKEDAMFISLAQAATSLGIDEISLLKMDIEGFEYDVMSSWQKTDPLPFQVSFELHHFGVYAKTSQNPESSNVMWKDRDVTLAELALFMSHLADLRYAVVSKEDNLDCPHCCEFTLIRVEQT
jgi:FkbM family methyltransferase